MRIIWSRAGSILLAFAIAVAGLIGNVIPAQAAGSVSVSGINNDVVIDVRTSLYEASLSNVQITASNQFVTGVIYGDTYTDAWGLPGAYVSTDYALRVPPAADIWAYNSAKASLNIETNVWTVSGMVNDVNFLLDHSVIYLGYQSSNLYSYFTFESGARISGTMHVMTNYFNGQTADFFMPTGMYVAAKMLPSSRNPFTSMRFPSTQTGSISVQLNLVNGVVGTFEVDAGLDQAPLTHYAGTNTWQFDGTATQVNNSLSALKYVSGSSTHTNLVDIVLVIDGHAYYFTRNSIVVRNPAQCPVGMYSLTGDDMNMSCETAPSGLYTSVAGSYAPALVEPGRFAINGIRELCAAGTYSNTFGASSCTPAPEGHYVGGSGWTAFSDCPAGYFATGTGNYACTPARAGKFVANPNSATDEPCPAGSYQPNAGSRSCIAASAGYFVSSPGSTAQAACSSGTTSTAGASLCTATSGGATPAAENPTTVAPVAATPGSPSCRVSIGGKASVACLLSSIGVSQAAGSKATIRIAKASSAVCKAKGSSAVGRKAGVCNVTVTIKPKKGAKSTYSTSATVG